MQREKLYKLQTQVYFNRVLFIHENRETFVRFNFAFPEKKIFYTNENFFFLFYLLIN